MTLGRALGASITPSPVLNSNIGHSDSLWSSFIPVTVEDIKAALEKMRPSSCPLDVVPSSLLLKVWDVVGPHITKLFIISLSTGSVPSYFKQAALSPILKKPNLDPSEPGNYRQISKHSFLAKILEKSVAGQLTTFLDLNNVLDKFQSGFRKMHSTETALLKVSNDVLMAADSGQYTVLVSLNLSSAFDTVDHKILLHRLHNDLGFSGTVLKWFSSYLNNRTFSVCVNKSRSEVASLLHGVPQGSVLGPILLLLYNCPLGEIIKSFTNVSYHLYVDDIQLYCSFKDIEFNKLADLLDCSERIKASNCLQLNSSKTGTLLIAPEQKVLLIKQHLSSLSSSVQTSLRNLGVLFDQFMSLSCHSKHLVKNCFYHLRNISKLRAFTSKSDLEMIIHAFISSRLDYCNSIFTCCNKSNVSRLQPTEGPYDQI
uniref:Reverse transcriptase domain-containing protein n=1 Tax=Nothobranchius furzeri TaxID=105023 RepID=A0A8C6VZY2_NOTFU